MRKTAVQPTRGMDGKSGMRALLCLMMFFVNVGVGGAYSLPEALTGHVKPNEMEYALNLGEKARLHVQRTWVAGGDVYGLS